MTVDLCLFAVLELGCLTELSVQTTTLAAVAPPPWARPPTGQPTPHDSDGFANAVREAADHLPIEQAHALWLIDVCGLTYAQAAAETGISPKWFAKRLHTARTTIRKAVT